MSVVTKESNPKLYNALFPEDEIKEKFYSLEELKRTIDCYDGYLDNEEVYYFVGALRFAYDYITNLQECCKDKIDRYQEMILKYCELDEKYKKSCETYQQALDETMSEKMNLEDIRKKAIEYIKHKQELNKMFGTIILSKDSQKELLNILGGDDNAINSK